MSVKMDQAYRKLEFPGERRRVIGRIIAYGTGREIGRSCLSEFVAATAVQHPTVDIAAEELERAGVDARPGTKFFALANISATTRDDIQPSDFEPIQPGDLNHNIQPGR